MSLMVIAGIAGVLQLSKMGKKSKAARRKQQRFVVGDAEETSTSEPTEEDVEAEGAAEDVFFLCEEAKFPIPMCASIALDTYMNEGGVFPGDISNWQDAMGLEPTGEYDDITMEMMEVAVGIMENEEEAKAASGGGSGKGESAGGGSGSGSGGGAGGGGSSPQAISQAFEIATAVIKQRRPGSFRKPGSSRRPFRPQRRPNRKPVKTSLPSKRRPGQYRPSTSAPARGGFRRPAPAPSAPARGQRRPPAPPAPKPQGMRQPSKPSEPPKRRR